MTRVLYDLDVLRTFCTGVELGSFARAADRLGRSTSAVSAQLKKLESQCGTPLLRKSGRGLVLTEAGDTLRGYALRLLELNDRADRQRTRLNSSHTVISYGVFCLDINHRSNDQQLCPVHRPHPLSQPLIRRNRRRC